MRTTEYLFIRLVERGCLWWRTFAEFVGGFGDDYRFAAVVKEYF